MERKRRNETWKNEYKMAVVIRYVECNPMEEALYPELFLGRDLDVDNSKTYIHKLIKSGYLKRDKIVSITSTAKGRQISSDNIIKLSKKGHECLDQRTDLLEFYDFASPYVDIIEYQKMKQKNKGTPNFEINMLMIILKKIETYKQKKDYIGLKNLFFDAGDLYDKINKNSQAMYCYLTSLYFDVCGMGYYQYFVKYIQNKISIDELINSYKGIYIDPTTMKCIRRHKSDYNIELVSRVYRKNPVKMSFCTERKFLILVNDIINGTFSFETWDAYFNETFKKVAVVADKQKRK